MLEAMRIGNLKPADRLPPESLRDPFADDPERTPRASNDRISSAIPFTIPFFTCFFYWNYNCIVFTQH